MSTSQPAQVPLTLKPGTLIGDRYSVVGKPIAIGSQSMVYRAMDVLDGAGVSVAIKVLAGVQRDDLLQELYEREVRSLSFLRHPHVIRLLQYDQDPSLGRWLALEYAPGGSLADPGPRERVRPEPALLALLIACCEALQQAHLQQIIHRDIKPSNILFGDDGTPKLADFGISKLVGRWHSLNTVRQFMTLRYASPEQRLGRPVTELSDVYSLGMVAAELMAEGEEAEPAALLAAALKQASYSGSLRGLIARMTNADPADRPTASMALAELRDLASLGDAVPRLRLKLTQSALNKLLSLHGAMTPQETIRVAREDLQGPILVGGEVRQVEHGEIRYTVCGERFVYYVVPTAGGFRELKVIGIGQPPVLVLDGMRAEALQLPVQWQVEAPSAPPAEEGAVDQFVTLFSEASASWKAARVQGRVRKDLFDQWDVYLDVQKTAQAGREVLGTVREVRASTETELLTVILHQPPALDGSRTPFASRMVALLGLDGSTTPLGMVVEQQEEYFVIRPHESLHEVPSPATGKLVIDIPREQAVIERQQRAMRAVRHNEAVRSDLLSLLLNPGGAEPAVAKPIQPNQKDLDPSNREAVERALGAPSLFLIQGPPGTGKTTVIAEIVAQVLASQPDARILITSQSNVAVDNVLERLDELLGKVDALRLGHTEKISPKLKSYELSARLTQLSEAMAQRAEAARQRFTLLRQQSQEDLEALESLVRLSATDSTGRQGQDAVELARSLLGDAIPGDPTQLAEYLRAARQLMASPAGTLERIEALQIQWADLARAAVAFERYLFQSVRVVAGTCVGFGARRLAAEAEFDLVIVDEAGRATPPEALVPLVRGRRFILVGDQQQLPPILDEEATKAVVARFEASRGNLQQSLFEALITQAPDAIRYRLTRQYRMHPEIGGLIEECFYPEGLEPGVTPEERPLGLLLLGAALRWLDTSRMDAREQEVGTSYRNPTEATIILKELRAMEREAAKQRLATPVSVGVLTGYLPQEDLLLSRIRSAGVERFAHLDVQVHTVDAAQGKEFDIVFYSAVRSNEKGKIGFLRDARRLNVALSRARDGLVIVGNAEALTSARSHAGTNPFIGVRAYFDARPGARLREVLSDD